MCEGEIYRICYARYLQYSTVLTCLQRIANAIGRGEEDILQQSIAAFHCLRGGDLGFSYNYDIEIIPQCHENRDNNRLCDLISA
jgi:hypothetical protein